MDVLEILHLDFDSFDLSVFLLFDIVLPVLLNTGNHMVTVVLVVKEFGRIMVDTLGLSAVAEK